MALLQFFRLGNFVQNTVNKIYENFHQILGLLSYLITTVTNCQKHISNFYYCIPKHESPQLILPYCKSSREMSTKMVFWQAPAL